MFILKPAVMVDCLGDHSWHVDSCAMCAPYWKRYPTCPVHGNGFVLIQTEATRPQEYPLPSGFINKAWCRTCRKHYTID